MGLILLIVLVVLFLGVLPTYGYSRSWGYRPSGLVGLLLVAFLVLVFVGSIPWWFASRPVYVVRPVQVVNPAPIQVVNPAPVQVVQPGTIKVEVPPVKPQDSK